MNRNRVYIILICVLVLLMGTLIYIKPWSTMPFKDLRAENVSIISVMLEPPGNEIQLSDGQVEECISLLRRVVVYRRKGNFIDNYISGQAVRITIIDNSNHKMVIDFIGNISVTVDGVKYKVKYKESEALNAFANALIDQ